jgi:hypothetical protein
MWRAMNMWRLNANKTPVRALIGHFYSALWVGLTGVFLARINLSSCVKKKFSAHSLSVAILFSMTMTICDANNLKCGINAQFCK